MIILELKMNTAFCTELMFHYNKTNTSFIVDSLKTVTAFHS